VGLFLNRRIYVLSNRARAPAKRDKRTADLVDQEQQDIYYLHVGLFDQFGPVLGRKGGRKGRILPDPLKSVSLYGFRRNLILWKPRF